MIKRYLKEIRHQCSLTWHNTIDLYWGTRRRWNRFWRNIRIKAISFWKALRFYTTYYLRRKTIYKKVLSEIYFLIYHRYQVYRIFITYQEGSDNYGEYAQWGDDVKYEGFMQRDILKRTKVSLPKDRVIDVGYKYGIREEFNEKITYAQFLKKREEIKRDLGISISSAESYQLPGTPSIELFNEDDGKIVSVKSSWGTTLEEPLRRLSDVQLVYWYHHRTDNIFPKWFDSKSWILRIIKDLIKNYYLYSKPKGTGIYSLRKEHTQYGITDKGLSLLKQVSAKNLLDEGAQIAVNKASFKS